MVALNDRRRTTLPAHIQALWAFAGLFLTIGCTFLRPYLLVPAISPSGVSLEAVPIQATLQVGAVLLTACLGGRGAAMLAQISYILLGLSGFGVFYGGGGIEYARTPAFGYLLGFVPGAWIAGLLAFLRPPNLARIAVACLCGLVAIHLTGILYICLFGAFQPDTIGANILRYSLQTFPSQLLVVCAIAWLGAIARRLLLY